MRFPLNVPVNPNAFNVPLIPLIAILPVPAAGLPVAEKLPVTVEPTNAPPVKLSVNDDPLVSILML